ncbi:MAG: DJ-1/PfpI family protein [Bifidobacteriaceae bacterium]|jgi:putative intracellular protease/amidase|nr:DJ-1/PfpI family protein [Bifidobacteriaceae bacterium]
MKLSPEQQFRLISEANRRGVAVLLYPGVSDPAVAEVERVLTADPDIGFFAVGSPAALDSAGSIDALFVPAGPGAAAAAADPAVLDLVRQCAAEAHWAAAAGSGGLILAGAGLLAGRRVAAGSDLASFEAAGAVPAALPLVHHGRIVTSAGQEAEVRLALELVATFYKDRYAAAAAEATGHPWRPLGGWSEADRCWDEDALAEAVPAAGAPDAVADLAALADSLGAMWAESRVFYHRASGRDVLILDRFGDGSEEDRELLERIDAEGDAWVEFPLKEDIREYDLMVDFAEDQPGLPARNRLVSALSGRRPMRHFKDAADRLGLLEDWYAYRDQGLRRIMRRWCDGHDIPYA